MTFPALSTILLQRLQFPTKKCAWCWTQVTYNEIDDQFALVCALSARKAER